MGLDIVVYKKLKKVDNPILSKEGYPISDEPQWYAKPDIEYTERYFPGRTDGLEEVVYTWDEETYFRAGSYSGYNEWREELSEFSDGSDFIELINFSDSQGVIGPVVSKKLYKDFESNFSRATQFSKKIDGGEYWILKYKEWMNVFQYASEDGAVIFC